MSERDTEFLEQWHAIREHYGRWGAFVTHRVRCLLFSRLPPQQINHFIRLPVEPRLKNDESLLQKAFYRSKNYTSPLDNIEDKVGIRFVVLLGSDVRIITETILGETTAWSAIKARDHEDEIAANPYEFGYQSVHLVVRSKASQVFDGVEIPDDLPCEVQIRTLLQHAYSEITHDTLYKPSITTTAAMKRAAAKSMALIEATGDYFHQLAELISNQIAPLRVLDEHLGTLYGHIVGIPPAGLNSPLNDLLLDRYGREVAWGDVETWLLDRIYLGDVIHRRATNRASFRVPAILLVYYQAGHAPHGTPTNCPLPEEDLEFIYGDLGTSLNG